MWSCNGSASPAVFPERRVLPILTLWAAADEMDGLTNIAGMVRFLVQAVRATPRQVSRATAEDREFCEDRCVKPAMCVETPTSGEWVSSAPKSKVGSHAARVRLFSEHGGMPRARRTEPSMRRTAALRGHPQSSRAAAMDATAGARVTRRALILFGLMSVIWGIPYLLIRVAVAEISPATLVFARTGIATLILVPIALLRGDLRPVLERWRWMVAFAVVEVGVPWVLLGSAEQHVTSSLAGLLVAGVPLVGTVIAVGTGSRHRVGLAGVVGLLVGTGGVAAIIGVNLGSSDTTALLEMGLVVIGYALGPAILSRRPVSRAWA